MNPNPDSDKLQNFFGDNKSSSGSDDEQIYLKKRPKNPEDKKISSDFESSEEITTQKKQRPLKKTKPERKRKQRKGEGEAVMRKKDFESSEEDEEEIIPQRQYNTRRKKMRENVGGAKEDVEAFLYDEAEESDGDDNYDHNSEAQKKTRELYSKKKVDVSEKIKEIERRAKLLEQINDREEEDDEEEGGEQELRDREDDLRSYEEGLIEEKGELYPTLKDPRLFMVKVKIGFENEAAVSLMNKYFALKGTPDEIFIVSVTAADKMSGFIFVEATRMYFVKIACMDIEKINQESVKLLKSKEVPSILKPNPKNDFSVSKHTFVRIKRGLYQKDLALVDTIDDDGASVIVKVVPRLDGATQEGRKIRPPAKLFDPNLYDNVSSLKTNNPNMKIYVYKKQKFVNGLLKKKMPINILDKNNVFPSFDEVKIFKDAEPNKNRKMIIMKNLENSIDESKRLHRSFEKGDKVKVVSGDLMNLVGVILEVNQDFILVDFSDSDYFNEPMRFKADELMKLFEVGNNVEVISGGYKGLNGFIIKIDENRVHIIGEENKDEIIVLMTEIKKSNSRNFNAAALKKNSKQLSKYDLLIINDNKTVGICTAVMRNSVTIVDTEGTVKTIQKIQIAQKVMKFFHAKNSYQQDVHPKCTVKIVRGSNKNKLAVVKHVYNNVLFLFSQQEPRNQGIIVESLDNCYVLESYSFDNTRKQAQFNNPIINKRPKDGDPDNNRYRNSLENINNLKVALIGQKKKVIKGKWKGYEGIIQSISDKYVKFELSAKNKVVSIPLDCLNISVENKNVFISNEGGKRIETRNINSPYNNMKTPVYNPDL